MSLHCSSFSAAHRSDTPLSEIQLQLRFNTLSSQCSSFNGEHRSDTPLSVMLLHHFPQESPVLMFYLLILDDARR